MNLTDSLLIEKAQIHSIPITPTNTGFTTVLVISALCSPIIARLLGVGWIYDEHEVARDFDGEIGPDGEVSGPIISMKLRKGEPINIEAQKLTKVKVKRKEEDVVMSLRIHLADTDQGGTLVNVKNLMKIGRAEFDLTVTDRQERLNFDTDGKGPNVPDRAIPEEFFGDKKGRVLKARILTTSVPIEGGERWYWGYEVEWQGKKPLPPFGQLIDLDGMMFEETRDLARQRAGEAIIFGTKESQGEFDNDQLQLSADLMDWVLSICPALRRDDKGNRGPTVVTIHRKPDPEVKVEPVAGDSFDPDVEQEPPTKRAGRGPKNRTQVQ